MRTQPLIRPFAFIAAGLSMMASAVAETFGNFTYTSDGTSVTITAHAAVGVTSLVIPAEINGVPVRTIASLSESGNSPNAVLSLRFNATSITIPEGITTIGPAVFGNFAKVTSITVPDSVTNVGINAFVNCPLLTSATVGSGVVTLQNTFASCSKLTTVNLPDQLASLDGTFANCTSLTGIQIPASVTTIQGAFKGCTGLTSVDLPAGMTSLGATAFRDCTGLQNVTLPAGLVSIGEDAFYNCTGLSSLTLPPALTTIGDNAFYGCAGLTSLIFPPTLTTIGSGAFQACTGLTSVTVPPTVTTIGDNAFWACENLSEFVLPPRFLASIANIGLDYHPQLASDALVSGLATELTNSPAFISKLADAIIAKSGHYGLSTQAAITSVVNQTPQTVRDVIAEMGTESPAVPGITSDLGTLTVKKGKSVNYAITTTFGASAFAAIGLPDGVTIDPATGVISGKPKKAGTYHVFLHAGVPGGGAVSAVKVIDVPPVFP
jgi:hypothetical protein